MNEYPKTLYKKGGVYSARVKGKRVNYDVARALDKEGEVKLLSDGWKESLAKCFKASAKAKEPIQEEKTEAEN